MKNKWFNEEVYLNGSYKLFCIPNAGSSIGMYSKWKKHINNGVEVHPLILPFRDGRRDESMPEKLQELAREFIVSNEKILRNNKCIYFGYCTGAVFAYEIARQSMVLGFEPDAIITVNSQSPRFIVGEAKKLSHAKDKEIKMYLLGEGLVDKDVLEIPEFVEYYFSILREDFRIYSEYVSENLQLNCPILNIYKHKSFKFPKENINDWKNYTKKYYEILIEECKSLNPNDTKDLCELINKIITKIRKEL